MKHDHVIRLGLFGCGGFTRYAVDEFLTLPNLEVTAVVDVNEEAAKAAADHYDADIADDSASLANHADVDLIYVGAPPAYHHGPAIDALNAGKHVIVEKPFAINLEQAHEMRRLSETTGLLCVANLMQRHNPLFKRVKALIDEGLLGEPLGGHFENLASDEKLDPDHWFWDPEISGGIFIEHSVHFFDLFEGWLGPGTVLTAQRRLRPQSNIEEQVHCSVAYGDTVIFDSLHSFTQPGRMDRQEIRLIFERGDIRLNEWIPTHLTLEAVTDEEALRRITELFPGIDITPIDQYAGEQRHARGRHKDLDIYQNVKGTYTEGQDKMANYGNMVRDLMADQIAWIHDRSHKRVISERNGYDSLAMATQANQMAHA